MSQVLEQMTEGVAREEIGFVCRIFAKTERLTVEAVKALIEFRAEKADSKPGEIPFQKLMSKSHGDVVFYDNNSPGEYKAIVDELAKYNVQFAVKEDLINDSEGNSKKVFNLMFFGKDSQVVNHALESAKNKFKAEKELNTEAEIKGMKEDILPSKETGRDATGRVSDKAKEVTNSARKLADALGL